ncbi:aspartate carbamoyltransferase [Crenobacter sp. SG2305]|uniref:aspartate carbamoyltransferase n=1 Tax=Crenobacter oryzisoli TaxID=3056844 RepID=UPI0025AA8E4B|nr:aspartate carbamoyltransferase [Crenobacter sp. SG2305]MDN0085529.1 aspartate carbamoyltransferase [Crenobacter sp. SG2305]
MKSIPVIQYAMLCGLLSILAVPVAKAADPGRQAEVSARGALVMPFELKATTHIFTKTQDGGVQQVVTKKAGDEHQIHLIREHLALIADHFSKGNFAEPANIHGANMPGLAELRQAKTGELTVSYQDLPNGGQIQFSAHDPLLVQALHKWFDAQLSDHGADAMRGHKHANMMHMQ